MKILEQPKWCWGLKDGYIMQEILVISHSELHLLHMYMYINLDV